MLIFQTNEEYIESTIKNKKEIKRLKNLDACIDDIIILPNNIYKESVFIYENLLNNFDLSKVFYMNPCWLGLSTINKLLIFLNDDRFEFFLDEKITILSELYRYKNKIENDEYQDIIDFYFFLFENKKYDIFKCFYFKFLNNDKKKNVIKKITSSNYFLNLSISRKSEIYDEFANLIESYSIQNEIDFTDVFCFDIEYFINLNEKYFTDNRPKIIKHEKKMELELSKPKFDYQNRIKLILKNIFDDFDWNNVIITGGAVNIFVDSIIDINEYKTTDIDLFVYGTSPEIRKNKILQILNFMNEKYKNKVFFILKRSVITMYLMNFNHKIQLICGNFKNIFDVIQHFDLSNVKWYYSDNKIYGMYTAFNSLLSRTVYKNPQHKLELSRIAKTVIKNYDIPLIDTHEINYNKIHKILVGYINPKNIASCYDVNNKNIDNIFMTLNKNIYKYVDCAILISNEKIDLGIVRLFDLKTLFLKYVSIHNKNFMELWIENKITLYNNIEEYDFTNINFENLESNLNIELERNTIDRKTLFSMIDPHKIKYHYYQPDDKLSDEENIYRISLFEGIKQNRITKNIEEIIGNIMYDGDFRNSFSNCYSSNKENKTNNIEFDKLNFNKIEKSDTTHKTKRKAKKSIKMTIYQLSNKITFKIPMLRIFGMNDKYYEKPKLFMVIDKNPIFNQIREFENVTKSKLGKKINSIFKSNRAVSDIDKEKYKSEKEVYQELLDYRLEQSINDKFKIKKKMSGTEEDFIETMVIDIKSFTKIVFNNQEINSNHLKNKNLINAKAYAVIEISEIACIENFSSKPIYECKYINIKN